MSKLEAAVHIELLSPDPDLWCFEVSLRIARRMLFECPWWRPFKRRNILEQIAIYETAIRSHHERNEAEARERTRELLNAPRVMPCESNECEIRQQCTGHVSCRKVVP